MNMNMNNSRKQLVHCFTTALNHSLTDLRPASTLHAGYLQASVWMDVLSRCGCLFLAWIVRNAGHQAKLHRGRTVIALASSKGNGPSPDAYPKLATAHTSASTNVPACSTRRWLRGSVFYSTRVLSRPATEQCGGWRPSSWIARGPAPVLSEAAGAPAPYARSKPIRVKWMTNSK